MPNSASITEWLPDAQGLVCSAAKHRSEAEPVAAGTTIKLFSAAESPG